MRECVHADYTHTLIPLAVCEAKIRAAEAQQRLDLGNAQRAACPEDGLVRIRDLTTRERAALAAMGLPVPSYAEHRRQVTAAEYALPQGLPGARRSIIS